MGKQAIEGAQRLNAFSCDADDLLIVGHDTKDGPEHPLWDGDRLALALKSITEEWVANLMTFGVLGPVLVRKNGDRIEVIAGRRRVLGARIASARLIEAGQPPLKVPCMVKRSDDKNVMGAVVAENEGRLDDTPIVRAKKVQRLLDRGYNEHGAAIAMCLSLEEVQRLLPLLDLAEPVQQLLEHRSIGQTVALTLRDLPREEQVQKAEEFVAVGVTVDEAKRQTKLRKSNGNGATSLQTEIRSKAPSRSFLRKLSEDEEFMLSLASADARDLLLFILGDETRARRIKGLTAKLSAKGTKNLLSASAVEDEE
jgi:ParB family chromosome partitioning protein